MRRINEINFRDYRCDTGCCDEFDKKFNTMMKSACKVQQSANKLVGIFFALWVGWIVFLCCGAVAIGYIAYHFISKLW